MADWRWTVATFLAGCLLGVITMIAAGVVDLRSRAEKPIRFNMKIIKADLMRIKRAPDGVGVPVHAQTMEWLRLHPHEEINNG